MRAAMPGATRLFAVPAPAGAKRGKPESRDSPLKLRPAEPLYMAGQDLDFSWYEWQIEAVMEDWTAGVPIVDIADRIKRDEREVAFLAIELAHFGRLKPRRGGIMGVIHDNS